MSAMPAGVTELTTSPPATASKGRAQLRAERRAEQKLERRSRRRWAIVGSSVLVCSFGLTVGILDVFH
jgi:hypothetical protein